MDSDGGGSVYVCVWEGGGGSGVGRFGCVGWCKVLSVCRRVGNQNRPSAKNGRGGSKLRSFCENVITECPQCVFWYWKPFSSQYKSNSFVGS